MRLPADTNHGFACSNDLWLKSVRLQLKSTASNDVKRNNPCVPRRVEQGAEINARWYGDPPGRRVSIHKQHLAGNA